MQTSFKTTLLFAAIAIALSAWAYLFERDDLGDIARGRVFRHLGGHDIVELRIEPGRGAAVPELGVEAVPVTLRYGPDERGGLSSWRLVEPFAFDAFTPRVESVLNGILDLERIAAAYLDVGEERPFDEDGITVTVRFRTREPRPEEHVIEVGRDHPDADVGLTYYRLDGSDVFLGRSRFKKGLDARLEELRSRALFPVAKDDALDLEVVRPGRDPLLVSRQPGTQRWYLEKPTRGTADLEFVRGVLDELGSWRIERFVTDALDDPARYGFDAPRLTVALTDRRGKVRRYEVADDPAGALEAMVYLRDPEQPFVFAAADAVLGELEKPAEEYRARHLLQIGATDIVEVVGRAAAGGKERGFRLRRETKEEMGEEREQAGEAPGWRVTDERLQRTYAADRIVTRNFIERLRYLEVRRHLDDPLEPAFERAVEAPPVLRLDITLDGARKPLTVAFHRPPPDQGLRGYEYVAVREPEGPGDIRERCIVPTAIPGDLAATGGVFFRNREIATFEAENVRRMTVRASAPPMSWPLGEIEGTWHLTDDRLQDPEKSLNQLVVGRAVRGIAKGFTVLGFLPEERDLEKLELTRERARLVIEIDLDPGFSGFKEIIVGARRDRSPEQEYYGVIDTLDMPVLLPNEVVRDFLELVKHLDSITRR